MLDLSINTSTYFLGMGYVGCRSMGGACDQLELCQLSIKLDSTRALWTGVHSRCFQVAALMSWQIHAENTEGRGTWQSDRSEVNTLWTAEYKRDNSAHTRPSDSHYIFFYLCFHDLTGAEMNTHTPTDTKLLTKSKRTRVRELDCARYMCVCVCV